MTLPVPVEPESLQLGEDVQRFELFQVQDFGVGQPKLLDEAHVHWYPPVRSVSYLKCRHKCNRTKKHTFRQRP